MVSGSAAMVRAGEALARYASPLDAVVVLGLTAGGLLTLAWTGPAPSITLSVGCCVVSTTTVAWRRYGPALATVVAVSALAAYLQLTHHQGGVFEALALALDAYTLGARGVARRSDLVRLMAVIAFAIIAVFLAAAGDHGSLLSNVVAHGAPITVVPIALGLFVARHREMTTRLADTTTHLRAIQAMRVARAADDERGRVARELHDVVAHGVSVMVIQAGLARITVADEPDTARDALRIVVASGREVMTGIRRITGLVRRNGDVSGSGELGISNLGVLLDRVRAGGLAATLSIEGTPRALSPEIELVAYRIVQESLTNIVKHAGIDTKATVRVAFDEDLIHLWITNTAPCADTRATVAATGSGRGLVGMRERVRAYGGTVNVGPRPDGGYEVLARIPLGSAESGHRIEPNGIQSVAHRRWPWSWEAVGPVWRTTALLVAVLIALEIEVFTSPDRRGSISVNATLVAGMAAAIAWRRQQPLGYLVVVNLLAVPLSGGLTSIDNATLTSTYLFLVPLWTVAAWSSLQQAVLGLLLTVGFSVSEGLYWHLSINGIAGTVVPTIAIWAVGRIVRAHRALAAELGHSSRLLTAAQDDRERLAVAGERSNVVRELHGLVADGVAAMVAHAHTALERIEDRPAVESESIAAIDSTGRIVLTQLRDILGLLRIEHDPMALQPHLGLDHIYTLIERSHTHGRHSTLTVKGEPGPLIAGADLIVYSLVDEVLTRPTCQLDAEVSITMTFDDEAFELDVQSCGLDVSGWPSPTLRNQVALSGGDIHMLVPDTAGAARAIIRLPSNVGASFE